MLVDSDEVADRAIEQMYKVDRIALDTETTGIDGIKDGRDYLTGISVGFRLENKWQSYYFPIRHNTGNISSGRVEKLRDCLYAMSGSLCDATFIFANAKFDIHSLATLGWDWFYTRGKFRDVIVMAHMINEELPSKELDWLGQKYLRQGKDKHDIQVFTKIYGFGKVPPELMAPYSEQDAKLTYDLDELFVPEMTRQQLYRLWNDEMEFIRMLARCERNGLTFVPNVAEKLAYEGNLRMAEIREELGFTPSESNELKRIFFDVLKLPIPSKEEEPAAWTPKGKPSLNRHMMEYYDELLSASNNPIAQRVLEYRGWQKAVSSWYESFPNLCSADGKIRTNFKVHGARTGRLSSNTPNLQQLPRNSPKAWNGRVRDCFTHTEGYKVVKFDFKNLELRLAADYCGIEPLLEAFNSNGDPHQVTADRVGIPRNPDAKNLNFAMLYGAGPKKLAYMLNRTEIEGAKIHSDFKTSYPGFVQTTRAVTNKAKEFGFIRLWTGRRKHYNFYNKDQQHKSFNALIQGGGAEIVKHAALRCKELESEDCKFVLTVHDELDFEIKEERLQEYIPEIIERMEVCPDERFQVQFAVEHSIWGEKE